MSPHVVQDAWMSFDSSGAPTFLLVLIVMHAFASDNPPSGPTDTKWGSYPPTQLHAHTSRPPVLSPAHVRDEGSPWSTVHGNLPRLAALSSDSDSDSEAL